MRYRLVLALFLILALVSSVHAAMTENFTSADTIIVNSTSLISNAPGVPYEMWLMSIVISIVLILISFFTFAHGEEGLISIMSWFTSAFALLSAFNVDRVIGSQMIQNAAGAYVFMEKHTLYHFDTIALTCLLPMLILALLNTGRIYINMRAVKQVAVVEEE